LPASEGRAVPLVEIFEKRVEMNRDHRRTSTHVRFVGKSIASLSLVSVLDSDSGFVNVRETRRSIKDPSSPSRPLRAARLAARARLRFKRID